MSVLAGLIVIGSASAAPCEAPVGGDAIRSSLEAALLSFAVLDQAGFEASVASAVAAVPCLTEPAAPSLVAALHRVDGIRLSVAGDDAASQQSLTAGLKLEPGFVLSETVAPAGGRLADAWARARLLPAPARVPYNLPGFVIHVDGATSGDRPETGPYLFQISDRGGKPLETAYVRNGPPEVPHEILALSAALPPERPENTSSAPVIPPRPVPVPVPVDRAKGKGLLVAGLVSGGVSGALYGTAAVSRLQHDRGPAAGTYYVTNGAYLGSIGTAALSGVLLTVFAVSR